MDNNIVLFSACEKLPAGTTACEIFKVMTLAMRVDVLNGKIVDAECTLSIPLAERFVARALVGGNLVDGAEELKRYIKDVYQDDAKHAIISAIGRIQHQYLAFIRKQELRQQSFLLDA